MLEARIAVVIPALDEEDAIGGVIAEIPAALGALVIVVDNGSRDATAARAARAGATVVFEPRRGYGRACAAGVRAVPQACEVVVFLDGDGSDDPKVMETLVAPVLSGAAHFVIGSRIRGVREPGSMAPHQLLAGRIAGAIIARAYGVRYTDMGPFRAIERRTLDALDLREATYGWNVEMQILIARSGARVLEIPVPHRCRRGGASKVSGNPGAFSPSSSGRRSAGPLSVGGSTRAESVLPGRASRGGANLPNLKGSASFSTSFVPVSTGTPRVKQPPHFGVPMYRDETLNCTDCSKSFQFTGSEQEFYAAKGFTNKPSRCADCRAIRKAQRGDSGGGSRSYGGGGGGGDRGAREMFDATCSTCGKLAQVPFQPRGDKPVYCKDCFTPRQSYR